MGKPLIVYKASAGSGKTFTLATEYIKLLIQSPLNYRTILAVTFTNKATEEMKMRILSQLYGIWKGLNDSQSYIDKICGELNMPAGMVSKRAETALKLLLHNYNYFRVETIDSFFQSVLRNLARELDLAANLRIGLNDLQIEELAVDKLIEELDVKQDMLQWIMKYINDNISDEKTWNVIGQIKKFGKTIFNDDYKADSKLFSERMEQQGFFDKYSTRLKQDRKTARERMTEIAEAFFDALDGEGLTINDLLYTTSGVGGLFVKLRNGVFDETIVTKRVADAMMYPEKWVKKTSSDRERICMLASEQLMPILKYAVDEQPKQWCIYKSCDQTLRHLDQLRLLGGIEKKMRELNEESGRFLLSDTQQLLHSLVKDSDSPFIFEKIGTQLEHVMIDEFQDTSTTQWQNFKVLLQECMSHEQTENLIVGDVKQSIYRWRSGDWRLLNNISSQFDYPNQQLDIRTLDTNYRSSRNIIEFNNAFFTEAAKAEYEDQVEKNEREAIELKNAYEDVVQKVPANREHTGYVNVTLLPSEDYQTQTMEEIIAAVGLLIDKGVSPGSIAILVRTNNYIPLIAKYFTENIPNVKIVSDEAFRLDASLAVNILVQALHLLSHPDDKLTKAGLAKAYQSKVMMNPSFSKEQMADDKSLDGMLPKAYIESMEDLLTQPLYDLTEQLYGIFALNKLPGQSAYVCAFYDQMNKFTSDISTDIDAFVNEWEETICKKTIQSNEIDGIRLISIHKSKGLEFDTVIIPFCDWKLEKQTGNIIWCRPKEEPYNALPLIPVDYSRKQLMGTIYEQDYLHEHLQNCVDNLNLLYVAFTRACRNLFVIGKRDTSATRSTLIQNCLSNIVSALGEATFNDEMDKNKPLILEYGTIAVGDDKHAKQQQSDNVFMQSVEPMNVEIGVYDSKVEFRQSNKSRDFIGGDDGEGNDRQGYINMGNILHKIFSMIRTTADIDNAMMQLQLDGLLYDDNITVESLRNMLRTRLADSRIKEWFSDRWQLFNECSILSVDKSTGKIKERRPDRVMIDGERMIVVDFKFGKSRDEYHDQVHEYMTLLGDMGYKNITGYLWFVYSNKIEEV